MSTPTYKRLYELSRAAARRYAKMNDVPLVSATAGLQRYFAAIGRFGLDADLTTIREILDTASELKFGKRPTTTKTA